MSVSPGILILLALLGDFESSAAQPAAAHETRIVTVCHDSARCAVDGVLVLRPLSGGPIQTLALAEGVATFAPEREGEWEAELDAPEYWMPRGPLPAPDSDGVRRLTVWRSATLTGKFVLESRGEAMPTTFRVVFESVLGAAGPAIGKETTVDCPVGGDGTWRCKVPAARIDAVLRAKTFTPHYKLDLKPKPAETLDLGTVTLRAGASLVAWLDSRTLKSLEKPARARLMRMVTGESAEVGPRLSQPVAESTFNSRGVVQLTPVPPGSYVLEISSPGFAPARVTEIEVFERAESTLRHPISLGPPVVLKFSVVPPREPSGGAWRVHVSRAEEFSTRMPLAGKGATDDAGVFQLPSQPTGRFLVRVQDAQGNTFARREYVVTGPADAEHVIEISLSNVRGRVTFGGKPLPATLLFGGGSGTEKITVVANSEGSFEVGLPRRDRWVVDVNASQEDVVVAVEVNVPGENKPLEIELADTEISGWVTSPDGGRVEGAIVHLRTAAGVVMRRAGPGGTFRFRGVPAGTATVFARDPKTREQSAIVDVPLTANTHKAGLELLMDLLRAVKGVVLSDGREVVGALVNGYALIDGRGHEHRAVTGLDGRFAMSVPAAASETVLLVAAAGKTFQAFGAPRADEELRLDLASSGGTLRLHMPAGGSRPRLMYNHIAIPFGNVLQWTRAQGKAITFPDLEVPGMASGSYRFCATVQASAETCAEGVLARGGALDLTPR
jgi:hypothetical protein